MSVGTHHYLSNEIQMKLCIQKALSQSSDHIKKNLQNQCKLVMNRYQFDISYRNQELGNDLYQLFKKIEPYNEIAQKLLCQYKPCQKLGNLLRTVNSCLENIFSFLKTHTQQRKNYTQQKLRALQQKLQIQVPGHCNRCRKFIMSQDIQQTKVLIGVGQFNDPYNLYSAGTSDFINNNRIKQQDQQYRLKYAQVWQNKKKIQQKFHMMQVQFDKRSYGYTYSANQIYKLESVIKNIISEGPSFQQQQYNTSSGFNGQVVKLVNKIYKKLKQYKQPDLYKDQQVQAGQSQQLKIWQDLKFNNQKLTKKNNDLKKKITQKQKQISQMAAKYAKLEDQYGRCIFQRNTNEQVMKNLVAQHVEAQKQIYELGFDIKIKQQKILQLQRQNQCLRIDIQKWLYHIQERANDRQKKKPLKSLKSLISKHAINDVNHDQYYENKSPIISQKQNGSHQRQNKRNSVIKKPVKKSISQLYKDQTGQHSRRNNKKLTDIIQQITSSMGGQQQYQDQIDQRNRVSQLSIKVPEDGLDYLKQDQLNQEMFMNSNKKFKQQRSLKKILKRSSVRKQDKSNRSSVPSQLQQKQDKIKVQETSKGKKSKQNSKQKIKNEIKQKNISKEQKNKKQKNSSTNKIQIQTNKSKLQNLGKKSPQSRKFQQLQITHENYEQQYSISQASEVKRKPQKSNSIFESQRKLIKKPTKIQNQQTKKSINSLYTASPTFQPISGLNNQNPHSRQTQPQSKQYHNLFTQTLPDINKNACTRQDKSKTVNQTIDNQNTSKHKRSIQDLQCEELYRKLYKYYIFQIQLYVQSQQSLQQASRQSQRIHTNQQLSQSQCPQILSNPSSLMPLQLQQFSIKIQNYIKYLIKQCLNTTISQADNIKQNTPYNNLNRALKISKLSTLSASIHNYDLLANNGNQQYYNQISQKTQNYNKSDINMNQDSIKNLKKQSVISLYSSNNNHKRKRKDSLMIIQKLTQKLTKLFFSQQQAYQIQKCKLSSLNPNSTPNTVIYNANQSLCSYNNTSNTIIKQTKKYNKNNSANFQLNQLLNRYQINYLKIIMILFVKLHNKYPQIYQILKRNIMFPYSSTRSTVTIHNNNNNSNIGSIYSGTTPYNNNSKLQKIQRKTLGYRQLQQLTNTINGYGCGSNYMRQAVIKLIVSHRKCLNCYQHKNNKKYNQTNNLRATSNTVHTDNTKRDSINVNNNVNKFAGQYRNIKYICKHLLEFQKFIQIQFQLTYDHNIQQSKDQDNKQNQDITKDNQELLLKKQRKQKQKIEQYQDNNKLEIKGRNQFSKKVEK